MDVLELPKPVINFLRTMSKEMNRYSLSWDIFGGSDSVTLTLTWKQVDMKDDIDLYRQNSGLPSDTRKSRSNKEDTFERVDVKSPRGKSLESINQYQSQNHQQELNKIRTHSPAPLHNPEILKKCPPTSLAYMKRKEQTRANGFSNCKTMSGINEIVKSTKKQTSITPSTNNQIEATNDIDPWIKRDDIQQTELRKKRPPQSINNDPMIETKSFNSNETNSSNSNQNKVTFDPNLHYI